MGIVDRKGTVSAMNRLLCSTTPDNNNQTKIQWERDIGTSTSTTQWDAALRNSTKISKCVRYEIEDST